MAGSLFLTGSSGFIGSRLLEKIDPQRYDHVYCLTRDAAWASRLAMGGHIRVIQGGLFDSHRYAGFLESCDAVVHLAAATGKARPEEYFRVNVEGTKALLEQCRRSGVKNFLHISSIAVKFQDKSEYYYAQSKERAEEEVRNSGLNYAIIRPTMVLGKGSPVWKNLSKLAKVPWVVVFGEGRNQIQPIDVEDLAQGILSILEEKAFFNQTLEMGGPEVTTIEDFLQRAHRTLYGRNSKVIHIPLRPLFSLLSRVGPLLGPLLPISAGQLASFTNDGTIETSPWFQCHRPGLRDIDGMLRTMAGNA